MLLKKTYQHSGGWMKQGSYTVLYMFYLKFRQLQFLASKDYEVFFLSISRYLLCSGISAKHTQSQKHPGKKWKGLIYPAEQNPFMNA